MIWVTILFLYTRLITFCMKKIYLIDGNSLIYRMFYAVPPFSTTSWKMVNAIFGVAKFFLGQISQENPDYLVFVRDAKWENFRHQVYTEYKATRERMPDNLRSQVDDINDMVNKMWFQVIEISWYEADDVIATLAKKYGDEYEVYILTWDKDLHALVTDKVKIYDTLKRKIYWPADTKEKFEIEPRYVSDYLAIVWDSSDNFPGVAGIWPKKAVVLINTFGTLENIYTIIDRISWGEKIEQIVQEFWPASDTTQEACKLLSGKTLEKFIEGRELAFISKKLATLEQHVPIDNFELDTYIFHPEKIITEDVRKMFLDFEFKSLLSSQPENQKLETWSDRWLQVQIVGDEESLKNLEKLLQSYSEIVFDTETTSLDPTQAELVWVSIFLDTEHIFYINHLHQWPSVSSDSLRQFMKVLLSSEAKIIGHNLKYDLAVIDRFLNISQKQNQQTISQSSLF